jgi:hypothetical protein
MRAVGAYGMLVRVSATRCGAWQGAGVVDLAGALTCKGISAPTLKRQVIIKKSEYQARLHSEPDSSAGRAPDSYLRDQANSSTHRRARAESTRNHIVADMQQVLIVVVEGSIPSSGVEFYVFTLIGR